jgi:hypothetical protein
MITVCVLYFRLLNKFAVLYVYYLSFENTLHLGNISSIKVWVVSMDTLYFILFIHDYNCYFMITLKWFDSMDKNSSGFGQTESVNLGLELLKIWYLLKYV